MVLAGGAGRRIGGSKPGIHLRGRALIEYPLRALRSVLDEVAVIAKADVQLPPLPGVNVWLEPDHPRHPLVGIVEALALSGDRPVMVCAVDLPLVTPALIARIVHCDPKDAPAAIASCRGEIQPLLGCYWPRAAALLEPAARRAEDPVRRAVAAIHPLHVEVLDPDELYNVNSPEDMLVAGGMLDRISGRQHPR